MFKKLIKHLKDKKMEKEFKIKEMKIDIPEGYEIDKENSTFERIKFRPIKKQLPKSWKEFCETYKRKPQESWVGNNSEIEVIGESSIFNRNSVSDRNILPNTLYSEAILALCQLIQLRDCYNDGWIPDWTNNSTKHTINIESGKPMSNTNMNMSYILAFKSETLRDEFLTNFKDLIEIAKPLL